MRTRLRSILSALGPGFAVAATGVGAGDMVAASVSGARYGVVILWAAVLGAVVKYALNEGVARWQLATGTTVLEGWVRRMGNGVSIPFLGYLVLWSFIVAGALMSACGLAAHAMYPGISVAWWAVIHSIAAVLLVAAGRYILFERLMKFFIALMVVTVFWCAALVDVDWLAALRGMIVPEIPAGSGAFLLGVIGGVGGSVTILSYGYWIQEKGWQGKSERKRVRLDLIAAYTLTGLFGVAIMVIAAGVHPGQVTGTKMALEVANGVGGVIGPVGKWAFLIGFWGAVFTSMLGVWQGVPYLFADFMLMRKAHQQHVANVTAQATRSSRYYKSYLLYLAVPPMLLLLVDKPVWIVVIYSIAGSFFMPFLAAVLLYMNNRKEWVGELKNRVAANALLLLALLLFCYLLVAEVIDHLP